MLQNYKNSGKMDRKKNNKKTKQNQNLENNNRVKAFICWIICFFFLVC